jgi:glycosyltransferase involved in cell wall biosynthesis
VTDPRVRFVNLPHRGSYPEDSDRRWLVAGSPAMNHGAQLAAGRWIAPLDDDDEFSPDHVETLLAAAREGAFEMVYGRMLVVGSEPSDSYELGVYPPAHSQFGFQAALYLSALRFFEYETSSWVLGEPGDWNLCRRMLAAGVRIGYVPKVVTTLYPTGPDRR